MCHHATCRRKSVAQVVGLHCTQSEIPQADWQFANAPVNMVVMYQCQYHDNMVKMGHCTIEVEQLVFVREEWPAPSTVSSAILSDVKAVVSHTDVR